jgi:orotidine-5'-phosphate decarboxylase
MTHFADRLAQAIQSKGNTLCVGLDPRWDLLPLSIRTRHGGESLAGVAGAYEEFCTRILGMVADFVPVVKAQMAFFEGAGPEGLVVLQRLLARARQRGVLTILDGKRNDIASTASAYADAAFAGTAIAGQRHPVWEADAITVNPYLGRDAIEPFLASARKVGAGVFVLVRTSNPGAGQFQDLECAGKPLYRHVGEAVRSWARENLGECGFGDVGAVVGATYPTELAELRAELPEVIFLVPGFGAQGGSAADVAGAFRPDGLGAVVNSSRGILFPFAPGDTNWEDQVVLATVTAARQLSGGSWSKPAWMARC